MALSELQPLPPVDQRQRLEAMLAELLPQAPEGVTLAAEWVPNVDGWKIWVTDAGSANDQVHGRFAQQAWELADKHGIDIDLIPVGVRDWD